MNTDLGTVLKMLAGREGDAVFCNDLFHDASTDETPQSHALAKSAVEGEHPRKTILRPFSTSGLKLREDFGADAREESRKVWSSSQVEDEIGESDRR